MSYYKKNQIQKFFKDFKNEKNYIGEFKLIKRIKKGLDFLIETQNKDEYYSYEYWVVEAFNSPSYARGHTVNLAKRYPITKAKNPAMEYENEQEPLSESFISIDGIESF